MPPNDVALRLEALDESHRPVSKLVAGGRSDLVELRLVNQLLDPCLFTGFEELDFEPCPLDGIDEPSLFPVPRHHEGPIDHRRGHEASFLRSPSTDGERLRPPVHCRSGADSRLRCRPRLPLPKAFHDVRGDDRRSRSRAHQLPTKNQIGPDGEREAALPRTRPIPAHSMTSSVSGRVPRR